MSGLVCAFTGHRDIPAKDFAAVRDFTKKTVDLLIARGVTEFITGGAAGYDMLAAEIVIEAKKYASVKLVVAVPCKGQERYYSRCDKERYRCIIEMADDIETLEKIILSCSKMDSPDSSINLIIAEEMPAYFLGQKDLSSVVKIMQDRMQKVQK